MVITAVQAQVKNSERVNIMVDGEFAFSLTVNQLLEEKLKKGMQLDEVQLEALKKKSEDGKIRARAFEWLMLRPHSTRELRDYLRRKKVDQELSDVWVGDFTRKGYVDDEKFASWFIEQRQRKNKSNMEIRAELAGKGVDKEIVDRAMSDASGTDAEVLLALIKKLRTKTRYSDEKRLVAYLARKGFRYSQIRDALDCVED